MQRTFTVLPLLLLLFILFGCNDPTNPKTKSVRDVYDKMAKEYGPAEEINTYSSFRQRKRTRTDVPLSCRGTDGQSLVWRSRNDSPRQPAP